MFRQKPVNEIPDKICEYIFEKALTKKKFKTSLKKP